jgi:hypothetical protein
MNWRVKDPCGAFGRQPRVEGNCMKEMTPRNWGQSLTACIEELNRYIKGWVAYYRQCSEEAVRNWKKMDAHVRRRLRAIVIRQKKRPGYLYRHLLSRGGPNARRRERRGAVAGYGIAAPAKECTWGITSTGSPNTWCR